MLRTYRYRIYPTDEQQQVMTEMLNLARWLYNRALEYRRKRWRESRRGVSLAEQNVMWRDWRNEQPEDNPLRLLNMGAGQRVLRRLDIAYRDFFTGKRGYPRFKGWRYFNTLSYTADNGAGIQGGRLRLQNVGTMAIKWHRPLPDGKLKAISINRKASGWYVLFQLELPDPEPEASPNPPVGIDIGIYHALALSDGTIIDSPQYLKQSLERLRRLQRKVARRKKGSQRREKAIKQLVKEHEHIARQRRDWWHKVTCWLVNTYGAVALEDLKLGFMLQNGSLARAAHDVGLGMFRDLLEYKAVEGGVELAWVNPYHTSQLCANPECGELVVKDLADRVHACPHCGFTVDRDINAALNILNLAAAVQTE